MNKFPIELKQVYFTRSIVVAIAEHAQKENTADVSSPRVSSAPVNSINVSFIDGSDNEYVVVMQTLLNMDKDPSDPYMIDMECVALFHVSSELSKEEAMKGVTITGHSVVYGAIREAVAWITGRNPFGALNLGLSVLTPSKSNTTEES